MKKTIFAIFFLICLTVVGNSAISINILNFNKYLNSCSVIDEEKPDFIIASLTWVKCRCPYGYIVRVLINNIGAEIDYTIVKIKVKLDSQEKIIFINYTKGTGISAKKTADLEINPFKKTHIVYAEVDPPYSGHPDGDIIESNENNNILTKSFIKNSTQRVNSRLQIIWLAGASD